MDEISNSDITVVVQGPVHRSPGETTEAGVTQRSVSTIRKRFPGATVILSTWENEQTDGIFYDKLLLSPDPGPTIVKYHKDGTPHTVNINRQIVSTLAGLREVQTTFAMKLRSDNVLSSDRVKRLASRYPRRIPDYRFTIDRIVGSNLFAKEYSQGLPVPFFPSDFFQFGRTEDLLALWDIPLLGDYQYDEKLAGKRQHDRYPWPQLPVEQMLWLAFVNKFISVELPHKFGTGREQIALSRRIFANNLIIAERSELQLEVPSRLDQNNGYPYTYYTLKRWEQLYRQYIDSDFVVEGSKILNLKRLFARVIRFTIEGIKQRVRLWLCKFYNIS